MVKNITVIQNEKAKKLKGILSPREAGRAIGLSHPTVMKIWNAQEILTKGHDKKKGLGKAILKNLKNNG